MRLEVVVVPVADVDRAQGLYYRLGWRLDGDGSAGDDYRIVQMTPPGSDASIIFGKRVTSDQPGSIDSLLGAVDDINAARDEILSRGVESSEVFHDAGAAFTPARTGGPPVRIPKAVPTRRMPRSAIPTANGWLPEETTERLPGRV
jgi:hypothetical protein